MKIIYSISIFLLILSVSSCDSWLDNPPYDRIEDDKLFSTEPGAQRALNGLYLGLLEGKLYGENLSCTFLEVLAQHYYIPDANHRFYDASVYDYDKASATVNSIWSGLYTLIADCNAFLEDLEAHQDKYNANNYKLYRGEALALRTYLHFDLFRLFGPLHADDASEMEKEYIPYYAKFTDIPEPFMKGSEFIGHLLDDLDEAIGLLKGDPILNNYGGIKKGDDFWDYRTFRMNLFAAQALKARIYLYTGDNRQANIIATSLLRSRDPETAENNNFTSIIIPVTAVNSLYQEKVFFSEMIFCMHNIKRDQVQRNNFSLDLSDEQVLLGETDNLNKLFSEQRDMRREIYTPASGKGGDIAVSAFLKYQTATLKDNDPDPCRFQIQPLIRLGELYLMAAETSTGATEKRLWLEQLRLNRGFLQNNTAAYNNLDELITQEYEREFYLDGQYFFYLKRNKVNNIYVPGKTSINMGEQQYVLPIPADEINKRYNTTES